MLNFKTGSECQNTVEYIRKGLLLKMKRSSIYYVLHFCPVDARALLCTACSHMNQTPLMLSCYLIPGQLLNIRLGPVITF